MFAAPTTLAKNPRTVVPTVNPAVSNCFGFTPTSNCSADPLWVMPSADWTAFPFQASITTLNPSGYDFVGGTTRAGSLPSVNTTQQVTGLTTIPYGTNERPEGTYNNCNCGVSDTSANCYTNCNCACACACVCACDCQCRC